MVATRALLPPYMIEHEARRHLLLGAKHSAAANWVYLLAHDVLAAGLMDKAALSIDKTG